MLNCIIGYFLSYSYIFLEANNYFVLLTFHEPNLSNSLILMKILSVWENVSDFFFLASITSVVYYLPILIVIHWLGIIHSCYLGTFHYYYLGNSFFSYFHYFILLLYLFCCLCYWSTTFSDFILKNIYVCSPFFLQGPHETTL